MLAGFAADAQVVLPISTLATNALAAETVSAFVLSTRHHQPSLLVMKSTSMIPPLVALIVAGVSGQGPSIRPYPPQRK